MPLTLFVKRRGTKFPRYIVAQNLGTYWTGSKWSSDSEDALLFADELEAARTCQSLLRETFRDNGTVQHFAVPIKFEVLSNRGIDLAVLKEWLMKAINLRVASGNGNGPNGSVVLVGIWWDELGGE